MTDMKEKVYLFKVTMQLGRGFGPVWREMELKGGSSLHEFAKAITRAFNFNMEHAYAFYNNIKRRFDSSEAYTSFKDDGMEGIQPGERSPRNSPIHEVFQAGKQMLFLYDFGEEWNFILECKRIGEAEAGKEYPVVTKSRGEGPSQYPSDSECYTDEEEGDAEEMRQKSTAEEVRRNIIKEHFSSSATELEK